MPSRFGILGWVIGALMVLAAIRKIYALLQRRRLFRKNAKKSPKNPQR
jgi:uncharacterized membrane protein